MTISTYSELKTAIPNWLARPGDTTRLTDANVVDLITLAEARIWYGSKHPDFPSPPLRVSAMTTVTDPSSFVTVSGTATLALPTYCVQPLDVALNQTPFADLDYVTGKTLRTGWIGSQNGQPKVYTVEGTNLRFGPTPDAAYGVVMTYLAKFAPLSVTSTNWLLTNAPGVYLYSSLLEAAAFIGLDKRMPIWAGLYVALVTGLNDADQDLRFAGTAPMARTDSGNP